MMLPLGFLYSFHWGIGHLGVYKYVYSKMKMCQIYRLKNLRDHKDCIPMTHYVTPGKLMDSKLVILYGTIQWMNTADSHISMLQLFFTRGAIGPGLMSGACQFANKMVQKLSKTFFLGGGGFRVFLLICLMIYNVQGHTDTKFVFGCKSEC